MCCRLSIQPFDAKLAAELLRIGLFVPTYPTDDLPGHWQRWVEEEQAAVNASFQADCLQLSLQPVIANWIDHHAHRITGGIYFEMAAKYAEKVGGEIRQHATVQGCRQVGSEMLLLASYPSLPLTFNRVCAGFQEVFLLGAT